jgi:ribosomal protein S15P/S13E
MSLSTRWWKLATRVGRSPVTNARSGLTPSAGRHLPGAEELLRDVPVRRGADDRLLQVPPRPLQQGRRLPDLRVLAVHLGGELGPHLPLGRLGRGHRLPDGLQAGAPAAELLAGDFLGRPGLRGLLLERLVVGLGPVVLGLAGDALGEGLLGPVVLGLGQLQPLRHLDHVALRLLVLLPELAVLARLGREQAGPGLPGRRLRGRELLGQLGELGVLGGQRRPQPVHLDLERPCVEPEQHVALLERLVRLERHVDDHPADVRHDLDDRGVHPAVVADRVEDRQGDEQHAEDRYADEDGRTDRVRGDGEELVLLEDQPADQGVDPDE